MLRGTAQNPDTFFQAREACNPFYLACAGHRPEDDGPVRRAHRPPVPPVRLRRRTRRRARDRHDGLGRRRDARDGRLAGRPGREGRRAQGPPVPAVLARALLRRAAGDRQVDRRARPHEGAGRHRRAAVPGRGHRPRRGKAPEAQPPEARPGRDRRPLRPVVEGIHAGDGQGGLRRAGEAGSPSATSPSASSTT